MEMRRDSEAAYVPGAEPPFGMADNEEWVGRANPEMRGWWWLVCALEICSGDLWGGLLGPVTPLLYRREKERERVTLSAHLEVRSVGGVGGVCGTGWGLFF